LHARAFNRHFLVVQEKVDSGNVELLMFLSICSKALLPCAFHFEILVVDTPFYSTNGSPWPCMGSQRKQLTARSSTPHTEQHARIHTAAPAHSPRDQRSIDLPLTARNTARSGDGAPTHEHQHAIN
jgi:hypothetical protein